LAAISRPISAPKLAATAAIGAAIAMQIPPSSAKSSIPKAAMVTEIIATPSDCITVWRRARLSTNELPAPIANGVRKKSDVP
jgi:hypothetical protein